MADKRKKRKGFLDRIPGIGGVEPDETPDEVAQRTRFRQNVEEWKLLRDDLDRAMKSYLITGSESKWDEFCSDSVKKGQIANALKYRQAGVKWAFPGRDLPGKGKGNGQVRVTSERLGGANGKQQTAFEITETFHDHSVIMDRNNQPLIQGDGTQRVMIARIRRRPNGVLFIDELMQA